jgi:hypothetical protein
VLLMGHVYRLRVANNCLCEFCPINLASYTGMGLGAIFYNVGM